ncbi:MAG: DUF2752 domain-containing protein [Ruminococcus sp.]|jgi:hypothetical protein|nr:DUF2752 domain-containing protein [Ruminococcus sp.]
MSTGSPHKPPPSAKDPSVKDPSVKDTSVKDTSAKARSAKDNIKNLLKQLKNYWGVLTFTIVYMIIASQLLGTSCIFRSVTGVPCIGCGGTRAGLALMHGEIKESIYFHPLLVPVIVILMIYLALYIFRGKKTAKILDKALLIIVIAAIILYIMRMILLFPHTEPMTYNYESVLGRIITAIKN